MSEENRGKTSPQAGSWFVKSVGMTHHVFPNYVLSIGRRLAA